MLKLSQNPAPKHQKHEGLALLHRAVIAGHDDLVIALLDDGADIDDRTINDRKSCIAGRTALMLAATKNNPSTLQLLLDRSADETVVDDNGWSALHWGTDYGCLSVIASLKHDFLPSTATLYPKDLEQQLVSSSSPFHLAAINGHSQVIDHLLNEYPDLDPNHGAQFNFTALHLAVRYSRKDTVKLLLLRGALADTVTDFGWTPLHYSASNGCEEVVVLLLKYGADAQRRTRDGMNPELLAIRSGHHNLAEVINSSQSISDGTRSLSNIHCCLKFSDGKTEASAQNASTSINASPPNFENQRLAGLTEALFNAIRSQDAKFCKHLLEAGADPNCKSVMCQGCNALICALLHKQPQIAGILIERGATNQVQTCNESIIDEDVSAKGYSALHHAAAQGYEKVLGLLLQQQKDNLETYGVMPLHLAAANGHLKCVKLIVDHSRRLIAMRPIPRERAHTSGNTISLENSVVAEDVEDSCPTASSPRVLYPGDRTLGSEKDDFLHSRIETQQLDHSWRLTTHVTTAKGYGGAVLHMAVNGGHKGLVAYLLREGVNLELKDYKGWTALHCAAWQGNVKIARTLIQSGADVNCRNSDLETPLLLAVRYKRIFILDELFHHRVDFTVTDSSGCSAMDLAIQAG